MVSGTYHLMNPKPYFGLDRGFFSGQSLRSGPIILETSFLNEDVTDWIYIENKNRQDGPVIRSGHSPLLSNRRAETTWIQEPTYSFKGTHLRLTWNIE